MAGGFPKKPRILHGAFVEFGLSLPPLFVVFQFNPLKLTRNRTITFKSPSETFFSNLREYHMWEDDLFMIQEFQKVELSEESISFDIRLDATDKLNEGDLIAEQFGIAPQIATLELMVHPKDESLIDIEVGSVVGSSDGFSFSESMNPPMILFIWGRKRVLPVNIESLNITETEFTPDLNPIRATAAVQLRVIEGGNIPYTYSKVMKEAMSALNLANIADIANIIIPM